MKKWIVLIAGLLIVNFAYGQNNVAQDAYLIFENNCLGCHGESGTFKETLYIEYNNLIEIGSVIPNNPDGSELYKRLLGPTDNGPRMPSGQPPLSDEAIATIRQWIEMGAPDWAVTIGDRAFITQDTMMDTIKTHLDTLNAFDRSYARYFSMTHLYNAGEPLDVLADYQLALNKLVNSLSWEFQIVNPQPINAEQTIYYIDQRDYRWDKSEAWAELEQEYPYHIAFNAPEQTNLNQKLTDLQTEMNCNVPAIHIDWFIANASPPPLYHDILELPETDFELETLLDVDVVDNLKNAPGHSVWRAGFSESKVSSNNRVVERHTSSYGAYWKSYDFAGSVGKQNIFVHPISFVHDGGEVVFNLPNGLQAYYLSDAKSNRLDVAPIDIVSNPAASDQRVRNGLSCIGCHTDGMKTFEDTVRQAIEQTPAPLYDKDKALRLYVEQSVMDTLVEGDAKRYKDVLEQTGGTIGGIEPIHRFYEAFQKPITTAHAAAALGLGTETFIQKIGENTDLQAIGLVPLVENGNLNRDTWTANFSSVVFVLYPPTQTPVNPGPVVDSIVSLPGDIANIPDSNLRVAIAKILGQSVDEPITVEQMEKFTAFGVHGSQYRDLNIEVNVPFTLRGEGIKDLTGLEYAKNLKELVFEDNEISDLTPIANLTKIENLRFSNNNVSDLSPVAGLTRMRSMGMESNPFSDLSPLAGMEELESIQFSHNFLVTDISALAGKEKLKSVLMWGPPITDMSPLANLPNIETIDLCGNEISEIPSLENAPKLKELYLRDNYISDVSVLQNLTNLERLNLGNNKITDISPLAGLTNLKWLDLTRNLITNWTPLHELSKNTKIEPNGFVFTSDATHIVVEDTFTFNIDALFAWNLNGWNCNITFDSDILEAVEVVEGDFLSSDGTATFFLEGKIDNENGLITGFSVLRLDGSSINGSGTLLSIKFKAKKVGKTTFEPGNCVLGDSDGVEIPSETPKLEITIEEFVPEEDIFTGPAWDVNKDGMINVLDLIIVSNNLGVPVDEANPRADINGDGVINILDLTLVAGEI